MLARRPAVAISMRVTGPSASAIASRPSRSATGRNGSSTRRSSSGTNGRLSACATGCPPSAATTCSATTTPARSCASRVEPARCGVSSRLGASRSGESAGSGSLAKTSSAAPARWPGAQGVDERGLVDERPARGVDEQRAGTQQREVLRVDQAARLGRHGQVQADDVGHRERRLDRRRMLGSQLGHALGRHERVVGDGAHAQRARPEGHEPADAAEAEQRERLVGELDAREALALPGAVAQRALGGAHVARQRQQQRERVLGRRDDVGLRGVADDDARGRRRVHVHVVDADARAPDHAQLGRRRDQRGVDGRGRAHDQRLRVGQRGAEIGPRLELDDFAGLAQQRQPGLGDRLGDDAAGPAHRGSAASSASNPALRASSSVAPRCPKRSTLPAVRPRPPSMM